VSLPNLNEANSPIPKRLESVSHDTMLWLISFSLDLITPKPHITFMSAWLPNGQLKDGTLLFGPLKEKPDPDLGSYVEGEFNGHPWFVVYSGKALLPEQTDEVRQWAENQISSRAQ
jgi:hypothetical protein